jgi:hypothetical protein
MSSIRKEILLAIATALNGSGKPPAVTVHRTRARPITADQLPAIVVYRINEPTRRFDGEHGGVADRRLIVRCECRVKLLDDGAALDDALDVLTSWVVQAVMQDPTLGGLTENCQEEDTKWVAAEANVVYGAALVDFSIPYLTLAVDPDSRP